MEPLAIELIIHHPDKDIRAFFDSWADVEAAFQEMKSWPEDQQPASVSVLEYSMDGNLSSSETVKLR